MGYPQTCCTLLQGYSAPRCLTIYDCALLGHPTRSDVANWQGADGKWGGPSQWHPASLPHIGSGCSTTTRRPRAGVRVLWLGALSPVHTYVVWCTSTGLSLPYEGVATIAKCKCQLHLQRPQDSGQALKNSVNGWRK
jgi:hypothetical protein